MVHGVVVGLMFESRRELRQMLAEYRDRLRVLVHENYQLRHGFELVHKRLRVVEEQLRNTEEFLAVLQGEQINTTELNEGPHD